MKQELSEKSLCKFCDILHNDKHGLWCMAFPFWRGTKGIPDKYLSGKEQHKQVDKDQHLPFVFDDTRPPYTL